MKMKLEDLVWSKQLWEMTANGGVWAIPHACVVVQRTPKGFSLIDVMPFTPAMQVAGEHGHPVPKTATELLTYQRARFNYIKEHFEAAGLDFDDPKGLLAVNKEREK